MSHWHQLPLEISAIIIDYVADDFEALNNVALTCHDFCLLAQSYMFSTVRLNGHAEPTRLTDFTELLQFEHRGEILASYIKSISLLFCDDWFTDRLEAEMDMADDLGQRQYEDTGDNVREEVEEEVAEDEELEPDPFCAITFISEHAKRLRSIHLGPFTNSHLDWHETSDEVRDALTCIFRNSKEIILEGVANIPLSLLRELHNLNSFEVSDFMASGLGHEWSWHLPAVAQIPSLTSLAMHIGSSGVTQGEEEWWDMTNFLQVILRRQVMDLSRLTVLYLQLLDSPGRNLLIKEILSSCADTLQHLRLHLWEGDIHDDGVISLAALKSLRSFYLAVNLGDMEESLLYLTRTVETIDVSETRLEELILSLDVDRRYRSWLHDMTSAIMVSNLNTPGSWNMILNDKLSLLYQIRDDIQVTFRLLWEWLRVPFNTFIVDIFLGWFPVAAAGNIARGRFMIEGIPTIGKLFLYSSVEGFADNLDTGLSESSLTFRDQEEFLAAVRGFKPPAPLFGDHPDYRFIPDSLVPR